MPAVQDALDAIAAAIAAMALAHEGLRDYARLNVQATTQTAIRAAIVQYDRRRLALETAHKALEVLVADGYPALAPTTVDEAVLGDLRENHTTIAAALAIFRPEGAAVLTLSAGPPEPKGV